MKEILAKEMAGVAAATGSSISLPNGCTRQADRKRRPIADLPAISRTKKRRTAGTGIISPKAFRAFARRSPPGRREHAPRDVLRQSVEGPDKGALITATAANRTFSALVVDAEGRRYL